MLIVFLINQKDYESCKLRNTLMQHFSNVSHQVCLFTAMMDVTASDLSAAPRASAFANASDFHPSPKRKPHVKRGAKSAIRSGG